MESWSLSRVGFLRRGEITDSLRIGWNWPEERDSLTMMVMVGVRTEAHTFRSQVGIGSESDCLLGQLKRILEIFSQTAGNFYKYCNSLFCKYFVFLPNFLLLACYVNNIAKRSIWDQCKYVYSVSPKNPPLRFSELFSQTVGNFYQFFTHLLHYHFYTRLQIFIQISPTLTKLCNTKRVHLANF